MDSIIVYDTPDPDRPLPDVAIPATEGEVAELLEVLNGAGCGAYVMVVRRLAFERDRLRDELRSANRMLRYSNGLLADEVAWSSGLLEKISC